MTKMNTKNERIHIDLANLIRDKSLETGIPKTIVSQKMAQQLKSGNSSGYERMNYKPIFPRVTDIVGLGDQKKKRGSMSDVIFIMISLFVLALFLLFVLFMTNQVFSGMTPAFENITAGSSAPLTTMTTIFSNSFNYLYLAFFFGLLIGLVVTAYLTPTHTVFFPIAVILLIALVMTSAIISNIYNSIATTSTLASTASTLNIVGWFMGNLPIIITVIGVIAMIVLFSKSGIFGTGGFAGTR